MLNQIKKTKANQKGFTIIEVLIVLAIAGLIILIVFLAVPALQRNSRNTARKNDVSRIGGAVSDFYGNNNGAVPAASVATTVGSDAAKLLSSAGTLSQYDPAGVSVVDGSAVNQAAVAALPTLRVVTGAKCAAGGVTNPGAKRQSAIQYAVETAGAASPVCTDI